jgi:hypothetical protein
MMRRLQADDATFRVPFAMALGRETDSRPQAPHLARAGFRNPRAAKDLQRGSLRVKLSRGRPL